MTNEEIVKAISKATNGTFIHSPFSKTLMGCIQEYDKEGRPLHPDPNYFSSSITIEGVKYALVKHRWTAYIFKPEYPQANYMWILCKGKEDCILATVDLTPDYIKERNKENKK